jgi:hypothetical protein
MANDFALAIFVCQIAFIGSANSPLELGGAATFGRTAKMGAAEPRRSWQKAPRSRARGADRTLHLHALGQGESVFYVNAQIANGALNLRVAKQDLHGS